METRLKWRISKISPSVTALLQAWGEGEDVALEQLIPLVHAELRRIARRCMAGERTGHSLQASALVNEAYLRLVDVRRVSWQNRAHFLAMSARLMRRILVDHARSRRYQKRGGDVARVTFGEELAITQPGADDLLRVGDALDALARVDSRKSSVVELKVFGGLTMDEIAGELNVSPHTVMRDWKFAKAWLSRELTVTRGR